MISSNNFVNNTPQNIEKYPNRPVVTFTRDISESGKNISTISVNTSASQKLGLEYNMSDDRYIFVACDFTPTLELDSDNGVELSIDVILAVTQSKLRLTTSIGTYSSTKYRPTTGNCFSNKMFKAAYKGAMTKFIKELDSMSSRNLVESMKLHSPTMMEFEVKEEVEEGVWRLELIGMTPSESISAEQREFLSSLIDPSEAEDNDQTNQAESEKDALEVQQPELEELEVKHSQIKPTIIDSEGTKVQ